MYTNANVGLAVGTKQRVLSKGMPAWQMLHSGGRCVHAASLQQLMPAFRDTARVSRNCSAEVRTIKDFMSEL